MGKSWIIYIVDNCNVSRWVCYYHICCLDFLKVELLLKQHIEFIQKD